MAVNWGKIFGILNGIAFGDNEDAGIGEDAGVMIFRDINTSEKTLAQLASGGGQDTQTFSFKLSGRPKVESKFDVAWIAPRACTIQKIELYRRKAGTSGSITIDVNKNGTTVFTTQSNRPSIAFSDGDDATNIGVPNITSMALGDRIESDIDAIELGNALDLSVMIEVKY